jgi:signal peptidase II
VLVFILATARRIGSRGWAWALGLLLGGSLGNLTDRMVRSPGPGRGHVVDFIDYFGLFIGNVADIAIVGAAALIGVLAMRGVGVDGHHPHHGRHEAGH